MNKLFLFLFFLFPLLGLGQIEAVRADDLLLHTPRQPLRNETFAAQSIKLNTGVTLEYVEQGDVNGTPVVLLHGFSDSWRSYQTVLPHLSSSLHVFALSQRGHGNASKEPETYNPQDFAADLAAFIQVKGLSQAVVVGHSMGSTVAQCFAVNYPGLVKGLVLVGAFAHYKKPIISELKKTIDVLNNPIDSAFIAEFQKSTMLQPTPGLSFETVVSESRKLPAHVWKGVAAGWQYSDFQKALPAYTGPALIIWGDRDAYCPLADQYALRTALKNSKLKIYKGIGHTLHWEAPKRFAADLSQFVLGLNALYNVKK